MRGAVLAEIDDDISEGTVEGATGLNVTHKATRTRDSCFTRTQGVYVRRSTGNAVLSREKTSW